MMLSVVFSFDHPWLFAWAAVLGVAAGVITVIRRPALHPITLICSGIALLLFMLAAGGFTWHRAGGAQVVVMVDLSPSTRGAEFREREKFDRRIKGLVGETPYRVVYFSDHNTADTPGGSVMGDLAGERTIFAPPAAVAIVLFSDGRFKLPGACPPVFAVADPGLDKPGDASVTRMEARQNQIAVSIANGGTARNLTLDSASTQPTTAIDTGAITLIRPIKSGATIAMAQLNGGDRWPENDNLSLPLAPPMRTQRWFISNGAAPAGEWRLLRPNDPVLSDSAQYLSASVIVLDNLAAAELSGAVQIGLEQYVRDLGGALLITGGDRAFSQGFYSGSALEALSPLASAPPAPAVHWMLLADSSGSMNEAIGNTTRWRLAASAIASLLPNLPADDPVDVGSFADELTWWSNGKSARETAALSLPPPRVSPSGPTNLAAALDRIARESAGGLASELLVVSDADTTIEKPAELAARLKGKKIRLHVLAIGDGSGLNALSEITAITGGSLRKQFDPKEWAAEVRKMLSAAWPNRFIQTPVKGTFAGDIGALNSRMIAPWNRTWLKKSTTSLAQASFENESIPLCARWNVGSGQVVACAFTPSTNELSAIAKLIARPPRDPRFVVSWDVGAELKVRVDAAQGGKYLNDLPLRLELAEADDSKRVETHALPQTAPGRYELSLPASRRRTFATLFHQSEVIDRIPVAARYAAEFDAIGNDYVALQALARQTGGQVIDRAWKKGIGFPFPRRELLLSNWLGLSGAIFLALGLARWRYG